MLFDFKKLQNKTVNSIKVNDSKLIRFEKSYEYEIKEIADIERFPDDNEIYFIYAHYSFSAFAFILYFLEQFKIIECLTFSTFNIGKDVIDLLLKYFHSGNIQNINILINDKFKATSKDNYKVELLTTTAKQYTNVNVAFGYNHSKVNCIKVNGRIS